MKKVKYLVIGAGISGLSFMYHKQNEDIIVLEKGSRAGGLCKSFYENGFIFDVAGHFFHFHDNKTKDLFMHIMENRPLREVSKCAKVYYAGKYINAPFQYNIHQLSTDEFIECLTGLYYASTDDSKSFKDFVRKKYGAGIAEKFLIPYNEKLYACDLNELEQNSMGSFLPKLDFEILMDTYRGAHIGNYNDTFFYPTNGCEVIISALLEHVDGDRIHYNECVFNIDIDNKLAYTDKETYQFDYLINTSPFLSFAQAIGLSKYIDSLNYNQVLVLNLGFDIGSIDKEVHWTYFPGDEIFYRVGFYNNIAGTDRLSIYVEISYKAKENIDVKYALNRTMADLRKVGIINQHTLIAFNSIIINPAYAHITSIGKNTVLNIINMCEKNNVFCIGRYARWEYSAMDDSIEQATKLANEI